MKAFGTHTAFRASIVATLFGLLTIFAAVAVPELSSSVAHAQGPINAPPSTGGGGGVNTPPPNTGGGAPSPVQASLSRVNSGGKCWTCYLFYDFETVGLLFAEDVFEGLIEDSRGLLQNGLWVYLIILVFSTLIGRIDGQEFLKKFVMMAFVFVLADLMLADGFQFYRDWVLQPFMSGGAEFAKYIIDTASQTEHQFTHEVMKIPDYDTQEGSIFADLMSRVEAQIWGFFAITVPIVDTQGGFLNNIGAIFIVVVVNIAFLFVLCIFFAFMVEALFKFLAMGFLSPLLIVAMAFPITRSITWAALRINLGAMFTIIFAGGALGLTTAIVARYLDSLAIAFDQKIQGGAVACQNAGSGGTFDQLGRFLGLSDPCISKIDVWSAEFLVFFIIAFVSIVLHLQSKSLASNLSGANDGVGPAAATVAAAKVGIGMAATAGMGAAGRLAFGQQGASSFVGSGGLGNTVANISNQGLAGLASEGVARSYNSVGPRQSQPSPSPPPPSGGGPAFSSGSGGGGAASLETKAGQQQFANILAAAINGRGWRGARDRSGN